MDGANEITLQTFAMLIIGELATFGLAGKVFVTSDGTPTVYIWRDGESSPDGVREIAVRQLNRDEIKRVVAAAIQHFPGGNGHPLRPALRAGRATPGTAPIDSPRSNLG